MAALTDQSVGLKVEGTYGTSVTVDRWFEFTDESLVVDPNFVQGSGLRVGSQVDRGNRWVAPTKDGEGSLETELTTKQFGYIWNAALGTGTSTLVSGSTFQQLFTVATAQNSYTIQKGLVQADGTVTPYTFLGCMVKSWEFKLDNAGLATVTTDWDIRDLNTGTGYTAPTMVSGANLFHFAHGAAGAVTVGGALTVPTTTAIATGGTAVTNVRDFSLKMDRNLNTARFTAGLAGLKGKPTAGMADISGSFTFEYDSTTNRDTFLAGTTVPISLTLTSTEALSTGFATFQIAIPAVVFTKVNPVSNKGDLIEVQAEFKVVDGLVAASPLYVVHRTADTTL